MRIGAIALACLLVGCATRQEVWDKPRTGQAQFDRDFKQCEYEASLSGNALLAGTDEMRRNCLQARGWTLRGYR